MDHISQQCKHRTDVLDYLRKEEEVNLIVIRAVITRQKCYPGIRNFYSGILQATRVFRATRL